MPNFDLSTGSTKNINTVLGSGTYTGQVFYVSSVTTAAALAPFAVGGSNGNDGLTPQRPFATLVYALTQVSANRGDVIVILPGHTETVAAAATIAVATAGVTIIGLGIGSLRPTFNWTATASTLTMTAANCEIINCLFLNGVDAVVSMVVVSAADCRITNCEFRSVTGDAIVSVLTTASANRLQIKGCRFTGSATATATAYIAIVGGDEIQIKNCTFDGQASVGFIDCRTTATTDLEVSDILMRSRGTGEVLLKDTITASTGLIGPRIFARLSANAANVTELITGATFVCFGGGASGLITGSGILVVNLANEIAMPINWTQTTDA